MATMETRFGQVTETYSARCIPTYQIEVFHDGLHKYSVLRSRDEDTLRKKATAVALQWDELWKKQSASERRLQSLERQKETATERTSEAQRLMESLRGILVAGVERDAKLDWERLKVRTGFPKKAPAEPELEPEPVPRVPPPAPSCSALTYQATLGLFDKLIPSRKNAKFAEADARFDADMQSWQDNCNALALAHQVAMAAYFVRAKSIREAHALAGKQWQEEKAAYYAEQKNQHAEIDALRARYESKDPEAVVDYCETVLSGSDYPDCIPREFEFDFNLESGVLLLNCKLPAPDDLPTLVEVKYVRSDDTFSEKHLSEAQAMRLYDDVLYELTLRTIHELFQGDTIGALATVVFNGIVTSVDRRTGNTVTACILSVQASRDEFTAINLAKVDPRACFRQLRGVGSSKLHSVTPVAPIMELRREDSRFIASYAVAERLNEGYNLAVMDWEDFEHLIREIFEKEFASSGGEVKVTQASRDGGVDAVAFDPDPIRGGKIVIQAKRYAYTVGVAAVRDLYGTVMNEGATKGILVTTSDYGPDAYAFASGKPLTLLSGSNLLHLLGKHGVRAHINLTEARKLAQERAAKTDTQDT
jgi:restriction system protein